jgi:hypothetical protein
VADEIEPKLSPGGYPPTRGSRVVWESVPPGLRLVIPIALLLATVIVGFYAWMKPSRDAWSRPGPDGTWQTSRLGSLS